MPTNNILPNPLAGIAARPGDEVKEIPLPKSAYATSVNIMPVNDILPRVLAETASVMDSGSNICLADSSKLNHIADTSAVGPAIPVPNYHNSREQTQGCYRAILDVDKDLPHPTRNKPINIHVTKKLSLELILSTDFLKFNGAIINVRDNSVTFLPEGMAAIAKHHTLLKNEPITGTTVHLLNEDYHGEVPISKDTRRTYFLSQEIIKNTPDPTHNGYESAAKDTSPKQHLEDIQRSLQHATPLLEAAGLDPPPGPPDRKQKRRTHGPDNVSQKNRHGIPDASETRYNRDDNL